MTDVDHHLARSGGRLACQHPVHRFAQVPKSPARIVLPECAGRERWLRARLEGIGGSEVGALIGVSDYETAFSVWNKKKRAPEDISGKAAVEWGHRLEEVVAQKAAEEIGLVPRFAGGLWADRVKPHLRVTPDRFATAPRSWKAVGLIEAKTAGDDEHWESGTIGGGGQAPLSYQAQLQWQMGILGLHQGWLGCFHLGRERQFFTVEVPFDKAWFAEMVHAADVMWTDHILADEPPMHDLTHPRTEELLKEISPTVVRKTTDLPEDADEWLADYWRAKLDVERAQKKLDEAKNFFRMWTGDAAAAYFGEKKIVSYPAVASSRVDVEKLKAEYPEVAAAVTVRSSYRRLTITVPKEIKAEVDG